MAAFMGMRGTGDWATNQVPESWAQYILYENPNGSAPLFAIQSMFRQENVDSYKHHWWTKTLPTQAGAVTSIYINQGLTTEYVYASHQALNGVAGVIVYVKVAEALAKEFKTGHDVILRDSDQYTVDVNGCVADVAYNGASSYVAVKLLEADDNGSTAATYNLATVDRILIKGSSYPEGSTAPDAIGYDPAEYDNYVQEYRDTLDISDIARATTLRTGDAYKEVKRECAEIHSIGLEKSGFWGFKYSGTGDNGKPLRTTQGIVPFVTENASANVVDYLTDSGADYAGKTWLQAGNKFMNTYLAQLFRYLPGEALAFAGDAALLALNELAETRGDIQLVPTSTSYGLQIIKWITPFGVVNIKTHPLFSHETTHQKMMVLLHPKNVKFCPLVGGGLNFRTKFEQNMQIPGQHSKVDGYYTAGLWKFYFPNQFMVMHNLGETNVA